MHWSLYHYHCPAWIPSTLLLFNKMKVRFSIAYPLVTWLLASPLTVHRPTETTTAPEIQWRENRGSLTRITVSHPPMPYTPELRFLLPSCCKCPHQGAFTWLPLRWWLEVGYWLERSTEELSVVLKIINILMGWYFHGWRHLSKFTELCYNACILFNWFKMGSNKKRVNPKRHFP